MNNKDESLMGRRVTRPTRAARLYGKKTVPNYDHST